MEDLYHLDQKSVGTIIVKGNGRAVIGQPILVRVQAVVVQEYMLWIPLLGRSMVVVLTTGMNHGD